MRILKAVRSLGLLLLFAGAFVTAAHIYQHCIGDTASFLTGDCEVCKSIASSSVNAAPAVDPGAQIFRCQPEILAASAAQAELPGSDTRGPPQS